MVSETHIKSHQNQLPTSPEVVWLYPDGRGASVVVPEAAAEETAEYPRVGIVAARVVDGGSSRQNRIYEQNRDFTSNNMYFTKGP